LVELAKSGRDGIRAAELLKQATPPSVAEITERS
jgi:hypothetical protein